MSDRVIKTKPFSHTHLTRKYKEASSIYNLWYPRPTLIQSRSDAIRKRIEALLDYGYSLEELKVWFRLAKPYLRGNTNTRDANIIWEDIKSSYQYRCAYCGKKTGSLTKDHIVPVSKDGQDSMLNIVPACFDCNRSKNAKNLLDWNKFNSLQLHLLGFN